MGEKDLKRLYKTIKNGTEFNEVCEQTGFSQNEMFGVIELLKAEGYNIDIVEKENALLISKKNVYKTAKKVTTPLDELEHITLGVLSDTHCGSKLEQPTLAKDFYRQGKERDVEVFLHGGDINDGHYSPHRPAHIYDLHALGFTQQAKNVVENYPCVKRDNGEIIKTKFIGGSHDFTHMMNGGADIGDYIDERREDMDFLGYNEAIYCAGKNKNVKVLLKHPGGGVAKSHSYKPQEGINKMETGEKPQILLEGHYHKSYYMFYRNVHTFLVPCMCAQSSFMAMNDIQNIVGGYFIDLYVDEKGKIQLLEFEEVRYGPDDINPNDYLNCKKLSLKK